MSGLDYINTTSGRNRVDGEGIYEDLGIKLSSMYGEGIVDADDDHHSTTTWYDEENN